MISPRMYRQWFKPYLTRVIQAAKQANPDVLIQYHSDGMINKLVPDLLEAGIDILNPVQPECVDHVWIKETLVTSLPSADALVCNTCCRLDPRRKSASTYVK